GQRQRVAIGRALVRKPKVFLFDEPLSNLDAKLRMEMRAELKRLHAMLKTTVVYVTHDQIEAMTLATKVAFMRNGRVEQFATPEEIYNRPATRHVAEFVGSPPMNLLDGRLTGDKVTFPGTDVAIALPSGRARAQDPEDAVTVGIRPEAFQPLQPDDKADLDLAVDTTEMTGPELVVSGTLAGQRIVATLPVATRVAPGDVLPLKLASGSLHFFSSNGNRLD
ncbi:ABC transporter ATP-binding protein, partial [Nitratireductor pacificus]